MPKLKPETQAARRATILDAAEQAFAKAGFHATSIQDICKAAGISAGALYVHFASKEDLIQGICERNRREFADRFGKLDDASDFLGALTDLANAYLTDEPREKRMLCIEIGAEASRNPHIAEMFLAIDRDVEQSFRSLFERLHAQDRISPVISLDDLMRILMVLADGLLWRTAINPNFDTATHTRTIVQLIGSLVLPASEPEHDGPLEFAQDVRT